MNRIGAKIYYCLFSGNVLTIVRDMIGSVVETTIEEDCEIYTELKERDKESIGLLKFEYGEYHKLSENSTGVRVDLETKELIFTYDELPLPPQPPSKIEELENKISILTEKLDAVTLENTTLQQSQKIQDRTIVETDMKMMDLEWALEDLIMELNPIAKTNLMEAFDMIGRSATYFNQLKQMIEMENYDSKEEMERILNKYASGTRPRITKEEYDELFDMLYPPVYDVPTILPEVAE